MPTYTYRCENCGVQFEHQQRFTDTPLKRCPECEQDTLRKVYTPVGIVFKGSGFYATDHRSPSGGVRPGGKEKAAEADGKEKAKDTAASSPAPASDSKD